MCFLGAIERHSNLVDSTDFKNVSTRSEIRTHAYRPYEGRALPLGYSGILLRLTDSSANFIRAAPDGFIE